MNSLQCFGYMEIFFPEHWEVIELICVNQNENGHGINDNCNPETIHHFSPQMTRNLK